MACNMFLTLQPGNVKMPVLGYGTWQGRGNDLESALNVALESDLYLIHFPVSVLNGFSEDAHGDTSVSYLDIWKKMEEQVDTARTKTIGISNFSVKQVDNILKNCRIKPANIQVEMHVYFQQKELVDFCSKNGVTIVAYAPIGTRGYNAALEAKGFTSKVLPDLLSDEVVNRIAKKHSKAPAQILLRFLLQLGVAAIPKSVTPSSSFGG
ncbi:Aldo/keto reductase family [Popillia japonica]|uniref:Aldo/keto reductase family n=1 Tax=Popillia japonica TaxID=7064 RepID=A0AAW1L5J7_POPJA